MRGGIKKKKIVYFLSLNYACGLTMVPQLQNKKPLVVELPIPLVPDGIRRRFC
jgi:hypothetical protein